MANSFKKKTLILAGGGTGGHIYPALSIATAIQKLNSNIDIHFVGTSMGMESKIIPQENFPIHFISVGKLNQKGAWLNKLLTLSFLPKAFYQSLKLLYRLKPDFVLGVGGYASGPFVLMASLFGYKTALWEANAFPGLTNRWLSRFVSKCYTVFPEARHHLHNPNILEWGLPVRHAHKKELIENQFPKPLRKSPHHFHILCFGGSQGARAINEVLYEAIQESLSTTKYSDLKNWLQGIKIVHQIGSLDFQKFSKRYQSITELNDIVECKEFIFNMIDYYQWADIVICRGGASTLAELAAFGKAAIIIPLPIADQHQEHNAASLLNSRAALMILQKKLTPKSLVDNILKLKLNSELQESIIKNVKTHHRPDADSKIAQDLLENL